jgi:hypothetical protein
MIRTPGLGRLTPRRLPRLRLLLAVSALALALAAPAAASYWFFQGYLPTGSGTRAVFLGYSPNPPIFVRVSWAPCSHRMNIVFINNDYTWGATAKYPPDCDQHQMDNFPELHVNYGCQNPDNLATVWTNCYAGTNY